MMQLGTRRAMPRNGVEATRTDLPAHAPDGSSEERDDLLACIEALSAGDYSVRPIGQSPLARGISKLAETLQRGTQSDLSRVVGLSVQASETATHAARMLASLRNVESRATGIAAAAEEMVASVHTIGQFGENISRQAQEAEQAVAAGLAATEAATAQMARVTGAVADTVAKVALLGEFSSRIARIADAIKEISDQTNLLALNATIEAARAGDAGRGFSVVAAEVKALSHQTRQSTEEIYGITKQLQQEMEAVRASMEESTLAVNAGRAAISDVASHNLNVSSRMAEVSRNTSEIAGTLSEQAAASQEVASGVLQIAQASNASVQDVGRVVAAMESVERLIGSELGRLANLNIPGKVVQLAKSDHVLWKKRLANMMVGREGLRVEELANHTSCRLGKWYASAQTSDERHHPAFAALAEPHRRVHEHGLEAVRLYNAGQIDAALREIEEVERASVEVLRCLDELGRG